MWNIYRCKEWNIREKVFQFGVVGNTKEVECLVSKLNENHETYVKGFNYYMSEEIGHPLNISFLTSEEISEIAKTKVEELNRL